MSTPVSGVHHTFEFGSVFPYNLFFFQFLPFARPSIFSQLPDSVARHRLRQGGLRCARPATPGGVHEVCRSARTAGKVIIPRLGFGVSANSGNCRRFPLPRGHHKENLPIGIVSLMAPEPSVSLSCLVDCISLLYLAMSTPYAHSVAGSDSAESDASSWAIVHTAVRVGEAATYC